MGDLSWNALTFYEPLITRNRTFAIRNHTSSFLVTAFRSDVPPLAGGFDQGVCEEGSKRLITITIRPF
jgi:hypothetical protein